MKMIFRKFSLVALLVTLVFAALPLTTTYAAGPTPPAPGTKADPTVAKARLELVFARQQVKVLMIGQAVESFDNQSANIQKMLDKAKEKGLDVTALQAAFDAYKAAFLNGKPIYLQAKDLVSNRPGFDAAGKVTDLELAKTTVKSLAAVNKQYKDTVGESFKALREAIKAFREANPRPTPTPSANG